MKKLLILVLIAIITCSDVDPCEEFGIFFEENKGNNNFTNVPGWVSSDFNSKNYFPRLMHWIKENNLYEIFREIIAKCDYKMCNRFLPKKPCCFLFGKSKEISKIFMK